MQVKTLVLEYPDWFLDAACSGLPQSWFFSESTRGERDLPGVYVCKTCSVRQECLAWALKTKCKAGIFGGKTAAERSGLANRDRALARIRAS